MHKFFIPSEDFEDNYVYIHGDDVKHIYKVLRLKEKDKICINNCHGEEYSGEIEDIDKNEVKVHIIEKLSINNESNIKISLYQGLPKASKMDLIVQKSTELGVRNITPVITDRVVVKSELGEFKKLDRWVRIAKEACKQCKRSIIPDINPPVNFSEMLEELKDQDLILVPYENEENLGIKKLISGLKKESIKKVSIIIGPEGGFEESEIDILKAAGAEIITLGPRILRTETAGFVCTSLVMYELGDIGGEV